MTTRKQLVFRSLGRALRLRQGAGIHRHSALCVPDLAESLGIEVRFAALRSIDGLYVERPGPLIVLSALRPVGRVSFTAGHELGHHIYGHGTALGCLMDTSGTVLPRSTFAKMEEFLADTFSGFLLMPPSAVKHALAVRRIDPTSVSAEDAFALASYFGVGYGTLIRHLASSLRLLPSHRVAELVRIPPKRIRSAIVGRTLEGGLAIVDQYWQGRPIDIVVGDRVLVKAGVKLEGDCVDVLEETDEHSLLVGRIPGIGRVLDRESEWAAFVRVSRKGYEGRAMFRHLREPSL